MENYVKRACNYDFVIVGTLIITVGDSQVTLIEKLSDSQLPFVVIAMRNPYDIQHLSNIKAYVNTYDFTYPVLKVAAGAIFGKETVTGKLPVTITSDE